ncbi:MAG: alanine racemase [Candidatus Omnitrophica bacterium]|nr:alanine racemase [Candidatus Omnitrophota bacterium]
MRKDDYLTYCEIDLAAVVHNLKEITKLTARNEFFLPTRSRLRKKVKDLSTVLAVIKAEAYGHGAERIALLLDKEGVGFLGVSDITEGIALREAGIKKPILLFESTLVSHARRIVDHRLMPTVCTLQLAQALNRYAQKKKKRIDIHVKVDTGMGRLGIWHEEAFDFIQKVSRLTFLRIMGIFTHFPAADTDRRFTKKQIEHLYNLVTKLDRAGLIIPYIHAANSMGLAGYQTHILNLSRPGLMLYGLYPHPGLRKNICLKPVLSVRSHVIFLKEIKKGRSISYGRTFFTKKDMLVATIPIGYNDGYFRAFSNRASVLIDGVRCPVVGRVTMDQVMVDASHVKGIKLGTPVTVLGLQKGERVSADELAKHAGTINYEIVCSLGGRLPKVYKKRK